MLDVVRLFWELSDSISDMYCLLVYNVLDEPFLVKMTILLKVRGDKKLFLYPNIVSLRMHTHRESLRVLVNDPFKDQGPSK